MYLAVNLISSFVTLLSEFEKWHHWNCVVSQQDLCCSYKFKAWEWSVLDSCMSSAFCEVTVSSAWLLRATGSSCSSTVLQGADCQHMMAATFLCTFIGSYSFQVVCCKDVSIKFCIIGGWGKGLFISGQYLIWCGCLLLQYCIILLLGALSSLVTFHWWVLLLF